MRLLQQMKVSRSCVVAWVLSACLPMLGWVHAHAADVHTAVPKPLVDLAPVSAAEQTAVFSGGCFWGVQAVFQHVKGVRSAISGYAGGNRLDAKYEIVSSGTTRHAESVQVIFDPTQVSYGDLLMVFFSVAHDPTQLNRQGPDRGTQYRSAIFTTNSDQARVATAYVAQLEAAKTFPAAIVTRISPLPAFYPAEAHHQDYATLHPNDPYIVFNDAPKVEALRLRVPELFRAQPVLVSAR